MAESPDLETDMGAFDPQEVLVLIDGEYYNVKDIFVRGDNKLIINTEK